MNAAINHKLEKTKDKGPVFQSLPFATADDLNVTEEKRKLDLCPHLLVLYISVCDAKVVLLQQIEMVTHFVKHKLALGSFLEKTKQQLVQHEGQ